MAATAQPTRADHSPAPDTATASAARRPTARQASNRPQEMMWRRPALTSTAPVPATLTGDAIGGNALSPAGPARELLQDPVAEGGQVVRRSAGRDVAVGH